MSITREEILQIADLARLRLTDPEAENLSHDLSQILEYVDTLASLDLPEEERFGVGPTAAPEREAGEIPPDPMAHPPTESAPDFRDGFFVVPSPPSLGGGDDPGGSP